MKSLTFILATVGVAFAAFQLGRQSSAMRQGPPQMSSVDTDGDSPWGEEPLGDVDRFPEQAFGGLDILQSDPKALGTHLDATGADAPELDRLAPGLRKVTSGA